MKQQIRAFLYLALTIFFWLWVTAAVVLGLHFLFTGDIFSGIVFVVGALISGLYVLILKRNPTLREATDKFIDIAPPL